MGLSSAFKVCGVGFRRIAVVSTDTGAGTLLVNPITVYDKGLKGVDTVRAKPIRIPARTEFQPPIVARDFRIMGGRVYYCNLWATFFLVFVFQYKTLRIGIKTCDTSAYSQCRAALLSLIRGIKGLRASVISPNDEASSHSHTKEHATILSHSALTRE